jgi:lipid A 3-O-deacylase
MLRHSTKIFCVLTLAVAVPIGAARADDSVDAIALMGTALVISSFLTTPPPEDSLDYVAIQGGEMDVVANIKPSQVFGAEYRPGISFFRIKPFVGVAGTTDGAFYGYAGVRVDTYWLNDRLVITPSTALVGYDRGGGEDLGSNGLLRSGIDFQYQFDGGYRIGAAYDHMSHAHLFSHFNPGTETATVTFSMPLGKLFGN